MVEDNRFVSRIGRVWYEKYIFTACLEFFKRGFVVYQGDDYLSVLSCLSLLDEDEVSIFDSLLIHGVTIRTEEEKLASLSYYLRRDRYLCFDIFLCEYRHPACYSADEWDIAYGYRVRLEGWRELYLLS